MSTVARARKLGAVAVAAALALGVAVGLSGPGPVGATADEVSTTSFIVADTFALASTVKRVTNVNGWSHTLYTHTGTTTTKAYSFTVSVNGPGGRPVSLQKLSAGRWVTVGRTHSGSVTHRTFTVRFSASLGTSYWRLSVAPTRYFAGRITPYKMVKVLKVATPAPTPSPTASTNPTASATPTASPTPTTTPTVSASPTASPSPSASTPSAITSTHYSFLIGDTATPLDAARWNRCTTIRWTADFAQATPAHGLDPVAEKARWQGVFDSVSAITGYTFSFVASPAGSGKTDVNGSIIGLGSGTGGYAVADVVLTYGSPTDANGYAAPTLAGNVVGYGGGNYTTSSATGALKRMLHGQVVIDYGDVTPLGLTSPYLTSLYLHEFGHAMGLGHYTDPLQVMNPSLNSPPVIGFANGDTSGLQQLAGQPCFP